MPVSIGQFIFLCMQNTEAWPILVCRWYQPVSWIKKLPVSLLRTFMDILVVWHISCCIQCLQSLFLRIYGRWKLSKHVKLMWFVTALPAFIIKKIKPNGLCSYCALVFLRIGWSWNCWTIAHKLSNQSNVSNRISVKPNRKPIGQYSINKRKHCRYTQRCRLPIPFKSTRSRLQIQSQHIQTANTVLFTNTNR